MTLLQSLACHCDYYQQSTILQQFHYKRETNAAVNKHCTLAYCHKKETLHITCALTTTNIVKREIMKCLYISSLHAKFGTADVYVRLSHIQRFSSHTCTRGVLEKTVGGQDYHMAMARHSWDQLKVIHAPGMYLRGLLDGKTTTCPRQDILETNSRSLHAPGMYLRGLLDGKTTTWPRQDILETNSSTIYITTLSKYCDGLHRILTEKFEKWSKRSLGLFKSLKVLENPRNGM